MSWAFTLPVLLGIAMVLQGGLNRLMAKSWGLAPMAIFNSLVLSVLCFILWMLARGSHGWLPAAFRDRADFPQLEWWYWIPGALGLCVLTGVPLTLSRSGALHTFTLLVGAQLATSIGWDALVEGKPVTWTRVLGAILTFGGVALANWGIAPRIKG